MLQYRLLLPLSFLLLLGLPLVALPALVRSTPQHDAAKAKPPVSVAGDKQKRDHASIPSLDAAPQDVFTGVDRIVAVGDIHGDADALQAVLLMAGVIDAKGHWSGGKTHLVQTGDIPDRGDKTRQALDLLMRLEREAPKAGGAVHALLGNHELMNMTSDLRYVTPAERASYEDLSPDRDPPGEPRGTAGHQVAFSLTGRYGQWLRNHPAVIRIDQTLFLHGGIAPQVKARSLPELNRLVRQDLFAGQPLGLGQDPQGPLWFRGYAVDSEQQWEEGLAEVLMRFQAKQMVMGHTVTGGKIRQRFQGKAIFIDTGIGAYYGGHHAALEIRGGKLTALYPGAIEVLVAPSGPTAPVR